MEKDIQTEVLTRLTRIETKLDDYNSTKEKTDTAYNLSKENKQDIDEINDKIKWITRVIVGALITGAISIIFALIQK